jgi:Flp pilus assembly protein TadD
MGLVYLKTGKPRYAEHHFRRAAEINPTNAVLLCCIGMVSADSSTSSSRRAVARARRAICVLGIWNRWSSY